MFNPYTAKSDFIAALNKIEFGQLGVRIDPAGLKLRASGIDLACQLFANFIEEMAADADASMSLGNVHDSDARMIASIGGDLAGQIEAGAERHLEDVG
jgi:hypothetical protein